MVKQVIKGTIALAGIGVSVYEGIAAGRITKRALDRIAPADTLENACAKAGICGAVGSEVTNLGLTATMLLLKVIG